MAKPPAQPRFASDDNYPAGAEPEAGTATKVEPISGKKDIGWRPGEFPPGPVFNWLLYTIYTWLLWLDSVNTRTITKSVTPKMTVDGSGSWTTFTAFIESSGGGGGGAEIPLDFLEEGDRIKTIDVAVSGDGVVDCTHVVNVLDRSGNVPGGALATVGDTNRAGPAFGVMGTLNLFTGTRVLAAGETLWLAPVANGNGYRIATITVTFDRPSL